MARIAKPRETYNSEAAYLVRLQKIIEADRVRPKPWRQKAIALLSEVATMMFLDAQNRIRAENKEAQQ